MNHARSNYAVLAFVALALTSCATHDGPNIRGGQNGFSLSIGIDRAQAMGGPNSDAMKRIIEEEVKRAGYCPEGFSVRPPSNTAAQYIFVGRCISKGSQPSNLRINTDRFAAGYAGR